MVLLEVNIMDRNIEAEKRLHDELIDSLDFLISKLPDFDSENLEDISLPRMMAVLWDLKYSVDKIVEGYEDLYAFEDEEAF